MTVTVGIPFAREPRRILEASIRSVFAQSYSDWQLLLVADNAAPELVEHVRRIDDSRVRVLSDGRSVGLASRLNQIAALAATDILFRMDGDDVMHPDRIAVQAAALTREPTLDVLGTQAYVVDDTGALRGGFVNKAFPREPREHIRGTAFIHPTVAGRTDWFLRHPYDPAMARAQDRALWLSTCSSSTFDRVESPLLYYRLGTTLSYARYALSSRYDRKAIRAFGPALVGRRVAAGQIMLSFAKQARYRLPTIGSDRLYERRLSPLGRDDWEAAEQALARSRSASVPGWDDIGAD